MRRGRGDEPSETWSWDKQQAPARGMTHRCDTKQIKKGAHPLVVMKSIFCLVVAFAALGMLSARLSSSCSTYRHT